jgi:virulence factor
MPVRLAPRRSDSLRSRLGSKTLRANLAAMREVMRIGLVGLGDIARKAYLPAIADRADVELHLCTRNRESLDAVGDSYRVEHRYHDLDALIGAGVEAAFVHVATSAHVDVVSRLLDAGVHVYVDKPLADNIGDCVKLAELARSNARSLMVGFNRRFAPVYRELLQPTPTLVMMQKNRVGVIDEPRRVVFDDFVHVVDTLRFLAPQAELVDVRSTTSSAGLELVVIELASAGVTAIGCMNRNGGHTEELLETQSSGLRRVVSDLARVDDYRDERHTVVRRGDWVSVQAQRGFEAACAHFIDAVRSGEVLDAADALRTHEFCERIVAALEAGT